VFSTIANTGEDFTLKSHDVRWFGERSWRFRRLLEGSSAGDTKRELEGGFGKETRAARGTKRQRPSLE
jgi:hypothetical protein